MFLPDRKVPLYCFDSRVFGLMIVDSKETASIPIGNNMFHSHLEPDLSYKL